MIDDLRCAIRQLHRSPGFTAVAVVTLALAIGANAAIFGIADAVLFRPFPYEDPERVFILQISDTRTGRRFTRTPYEYLRAIQAYHSGVGDIGLLEAGPVVITESPDGADRVPTVSVSPNYFEVLGAQAVRGRILGLRDGEASGRPAMLSYAGWRQRFGAREDVVGRPLTIGNSTFDIVGVLPAGFVFPSLFADGAELVTLTQPLAAKAAGGTFHPIVRLDAGVGRERAQEEMNALVRPLSERDPRSSGQTVVMDDVRSVVYPVARTIMVFLVAAAGLVLAVGCANLANMLLVRTAHRERETAVRAALGAGRLRLVCPILFESIIIGIAGATLAVLAAMATFDTLLEHVPRLAYGNAPVGVDGRVSLVALAMGVLAGIAFSVVPAWRASRRDVQVLLQARHRMNPLRHHWVRQPMIALQVAAAIVLVFGAVIAARAFVSILNVPLGFDPENVVVLGVAPPRNGERPLSFYVRAIETIKRRADVVNAGGIGSMPLVASAADEPFHRPDGSRGSAGIVHFLPGYFEAIGVQVLHGRMLDWSDVRNNPNAAVVSQSAAAAEFAGVSPIGATFTNGRGRRLTVVGVVSDVRKSLDQASRERPFLPAYVIPDDDGLRALTILVRMRPDVRGEAVLADLKRELKPLAPGTPVRAVWWVDSVRNVTAYRNPRFQTIVLGGFASLALGLTMLGVFGAVAHAITTRTKEMGIRLALGALPNSLVRLTLRQALGPVCLGLVAGLIATRWLARLAESQLFAVETKGPLMLVVATASVLVAAATAAYLPARRAARLDPMVVLRME